jgi:hypothetical protein
MRAVAAQRSLPETGVVAPQPPGEREMVVGVGTAGVGMVVGEMVVAGAVGITAAGITTTGTATGTAGVTAMETATRIDPAGHYSR